MNDNEFFDALNLPEQFDVRSCLPGFEDEQAAEDQQIFLMNILLRGDAESVELADRLFECEDGNRCRSGTCRKCGRMFRVGFAGKVARRIANDTSDWYAVSIVPPRLGFCMERLHLFDLKKFKDQVRKQLERSCLSNALVIGGIDFAVQVIKRPVWRPHMYIAIRGSDKDAIHEAFKKYYKATDRRRGRYTFA